MGTTTSSRGERKKGGGGEWLLQEGTILLCVAPSLSNPSQSVTLASPERIESVLECGFFFSPESEGRLL